MAQPRAKSILVVKPVRFRLRNNEVLARVPTVETQMALHCVAISGERCAVDQDAWAGAPGSIEGSQDLVQVGRRRLSDHHVVGLGPDEWGEQSGNLARQVEPRLRPLRPAADGEV